MSNNSVKQIEIDIVALFRLLWNKRKLIIKNCFIAGVLSIIIAFSIPKEYTSTVVLAPEFSSGTNVSEGFGALASMAGIDLSAISKSQDALYPELYPQIVSSTPFLCSLMTVPVESKDGELRTIMYDYLTKHQKMPWWNYIVAVPVGIVRRLVGLEQGDTIVPVDGHDMNMTRRQFLTLKSLDKKILVSVDKGNYVITLNVTMQDPKISAHVANVVAEKLQQSIGEYRSAKARKDLQYVQQLFLEAQGKYNNAQKIFADYVNQHQRIVDMQYQVEQERLENEKDLAFNVYMQMAQSLEMARAKVQEETPVCVMVQPAIIPIKATSPKKIMLGLLFVFLAFFGTTGWIIVKDRILDKI
ncbi:MAG: chain-length determining protein [Bacteroidaceae bacterium]|nr:chain-length determining protein [Bacteroidaceae bacterium]